MEGVENLVEHAAEEALVDALAEADGDAAVGGIALALGLFEEGVAFEVVEGGVVEAVEDVVADVEGFDAPGAFVGGEEVRAVARADALFGERHEEIGLGHLGGKRNTGGGAPPPHVLGWCSAVLGAAG